MQSAHSGSNKRGTSVGAVASAALLAVASTPASANALDGRTLGLAWTVPFIGVLASIAVLPVLAPGAWHRHAGKIGFAWSAALVVPLTVAFGPAASATAFADAALAAYLPFVVLLFALYTVAGGIGVAGNLRGSPGVNVALLAAGAVLANVMGTTGAAMILVRPLIRANAARRHNVHVLVFFIFVVANAGGALTPLGDPPLFLGYLAGVRFFWTTTALLAPTATLVGSLLAIFWLIDRRLYRAAGEAPPAGSVPAADVRLRIVGWGNVALLAAIVGSVLVSGIWRPGVTFTVLGVALPLQDLVRDAALLAIAAASLRFGPRAVRDANDFGWAPMQEVAKLFAAIFATIVPVLAILRAGHAGAAAGLLDAVVRADGRHDAPMFFWLTGLLSALLDNAPTYLVFFGVAGGDAETLMTQRETLAAISCGAVFMGALTYVGNAPNLIVRAIAEDRGIRMPSFFGYLLWSVPVLVPLFVLLTFLFFR